MNTSLRVFSNQLRVRNKKRIGGSVAKTIKHKNMPFRTRSKNNPPNDGKRFEFNFTRNGKPTLMNNKSKNNVINIKNAMQILENMTSKQNPPRKSTRLRKKPNKLTYS